MVRLAAFALIAWQLTGVSCLMEFINPGPFVGTDDFSDDPIYAEGSIINIAWTAGEANKGASLVLYQLNKTIGQWFGDMEYLTQGAVGVTRYSWLVGTRKNLSVSNLFYLSIFQEGKSVADSNSQYFKIEAKSATSSSLISPSSMLGARSNLTSTKSPSASAPTSTEPPKSSPSSEPASVPTSHSQLSSSPGSSSSFPTSAKIGLGVGIPVALFLCLGAGFFLFRRHKKRNRMAKMAAPYPHKNLRHMDGTYYGSSLSEAPLKSPVEMDQLRCSYVAYHDCHAKHVKGKTAESVLYEM